MSNTQNLNKSNVEIFSSYRNSDQITKNLVDLENIRPGSEQ
jgi:hypothetical protein